MRLSLLVALAALVGAGCTTSSPENTASASAVASGPLAGFTPLLSVQGRFEVLLPAERKETRETQKTDFGDATVHLFMAGSGQAAFMVGYSEYPAAIVDPQARLEAARDGSLAKSKSKVVRSNEIDLEGARGIDVVGESPSMGAVRARYFIRENRLYQVVALGADDAVATAFLDSFKLAP